VTQATGKILVTGGARRIGRAICLEMAQSGWDVAIHFDQSVGEAERLAAEIRGLGRAAVLAPGDLSEPEQWNQIVATARAGLNGLGALVNNASTYVPMKLEEFSAEHWEATLRINLAAAAGLAHAALADLRSAKPGRIINICDTLTRPDAPPEKGYLAYGASKAALHWLTRALASELAPDVLVNGVAPGAAIFPESLSPERRDRIRQRIPLGVESGTEPIAGAVRFLLTEGNYITGQILSVDGGLGLW
jgi:pteridine reductase